MAETFFQWGEADGPGLVQPGKGDGFRGPNTYMEGIEKTELTTSQ